LSYSHQIFPIKNQPLAGSADLALLNFITKPPTFSWFGCDDEVEKLNLSF